ncbi:MAG: flagellar export chaperone FliS [Desulfobacteraceae bacterium]|nr:MAG: flagellar export chaperone FliS [Desulfobacteraceae bacterium]
MYGKILAQYQRTKVETAGKMDLVIMCYEKTLQALHEAKTFFEANEFEKKAHKLQLALDIIHELQVSLNFEKGGQIAANLDSIYNYISRRLLQGDIEKHTSAYDECIHILSELKEAWEKIDTAQAEGSRISPAAQTEKINISRLAA